MEKCDVCGKVIATKTVRKAYNKTLCCKHYVQMQKYGHFLDNNPYSINDSNEFEIDEDITYIILKNKKGNFISRAIIDSDKLDELIVYKWRYWKGRVFTGNKKIIQLSYMVMGIKSLEPPMVIDHINRNPLDNRKCNLRIIDVATNNINKSIQSNNTSKFVGVYYDTKRNSWVSEIRKNGIKIFLGRYHSINDAIYARYIAEKLVFKEFRSTENDEMIINLLENCNNKQHIELYVRNRLHNKDIVGTTFEY